MAKNLQIYEVSPAYIDYLVPHFPYLFHNRQAEQKNTRKFIGIILEIGDIKYFAPLSSFKSKHSHMKNGLDLIKLGNKAVINLNSMFPVPDGQYSLYNISAEPDVKYASLIRTELQLMQPLQKLIKKNSLYLYNLKNSGQKSRLTDRCNDFKLLEQKYNEWINKRF